MEKITAEEKQYIANDVLVIKEALEIMYEQGHKKLTIGLCCLAELKMLKRIIERFKECRHFCCFCKYRKLCGISWWKR